MSWMWLAYTAFTGGMLIMVAMSWVAMRREAEIEELIAECRDAVNAVIARGTPEDVERAERALAAAQQWFDEHPVR